MTTRIASYDDSMNAPVDARTKLASNLADVTQVEGAAIALARRVFDVRNYGAVGDGTADDHVAINAAFTAASSAGGGTVYLPHGSYRITNSVSIPSNVTLQGDGAASVIVQDMSTAAHALTCATSATNISVVGVTFDASSATTNRCAIAFNGATGVFIDRVLVKKAYYDAIQLIACFDAVVSNCIGLKCGRNGIAVDQTVGASSKVTITNCVMVADPASSNLNAGYDIESGQEVILSGCVSDGAFPYGCSVLGESSGTYLSKWVQIRGLTVSGAVTYGVYLLGTVGTVTGVAIDGLIVTPGAALGGVQITGDVQQWSVTNFDLGGSTHATANGITTTVSGATPGPGVIGNGRIAGYTAHGVSLASQAVVTGVVTASNGGSGVFTNTTDCVVTGCILTGNTRYGVESNGSADRLAVAGNNLRGNTSGDLLLVGSANMLGLYIPKTGLTGPPTTVGFLVQAPATAFFSAGTLTIDASKGDSQATLTANVTTMTFANPATNQKMTVSIIQDATGGRTYVWPSNAKFAGGSAPSDTTANKRTSVTFIYDGTNWQEQSRAVAVG